MSCTHQQIARNPVPFCMDCGEFVTTLPIESVARDGKGIELVADLRQAAVDIAAEGIDGWGNLCSMAADRIEQIERSMSLARKEVERLTEENRRLRSAQHTAETGR